MSWSAHQTEADRCRSRRSGSWPKSVPLSPRRRPCGRATRSAVHRVWTGPHPPSPRARAQVIFRSVNKADRVRVLLNVACLPQIAEAGALVITAFDPAVQLCQQQHWHLAVFGKALHGAGDSSNGPGWALTDIGILGPNYDSGVLNVTGAKPWALPHFFPCADSAPWILCVMCRRQPYFPH